MSCNTTCYTRDTCITRWHRVAIFGAVERMFVIALTGTPKIATRCHFVLQCITDRVGDASAGLVRRSAGLASRSAWLSRRSA
eukprot:2221020-Pleurochrysis_carterae.AAC.3